MPKNLDLKVSIDLSSPLFRSVLTNELCRNKMPRQLLIVYLSIYMHFQVQLMMNRLVILLAVAVVMAMCSAPSEGNKNFFIIFFLSTNNS